MTTPRWNTEIEFSNWLHGNIGVLAAVLGIELVSEKREARAGLLSADLLARAPSTGAAVIIENQIHPANHGHFGQVLTYAAHYDAAIIVWIATKIRDEYRLAFGWLNSLSTKRFYAVELNRDELPIFRVVAAPRVSGMAQLPLTITASRDSHGTEQDGMYLPAPFAVKATPDASPGQLGLNAIFERIAAMLEGSATFPSRRRPTGGR